MQKTTFFLFSILVSLKAFGWQIGPFERVDEANPIITPSHDSVFFCPVQEQEVHWETGHTFNPGAIVREGKVYLFYRAEDSIGTGVGLQTSRIGIAHSDDALHFKKAKEPILFPNKDAQERSEFPGGCEDPRLVETEDGTYVMSYTQWNRDVAILAIATSKDLMTWEKHGYAFQGHMRKRWSKSGSIVCRQEGDKLIATKVQGKYWMYWGEGLIHIAHSEDLISWTPVKDADGVLLAVLEPRAGKFDSILVEAGPPALLTSGGILLLYNGKNSGIKGDPQIPARAYSAGQVLFDLSNPTQIVSRCEECFLTPEKSYEKVGQYLGGTVFIQGLVPFQGNWFLYYGTADSATAVARCKISQ